MRYLLIITACMLALHCSETPDKGPTSNTHTKDWALVPFQKVDSSNPVMGPGTGVFFSPLFKKEIRWEQKDVFNPAAVVRGNKIYMLYRAEDTVGRYAGVSRIGLAESSDGIHFTRHPVPVLHPKEDSFKMYEWEGGCEDPRVVEDSSGTYFMTYTAYDGNVARMLVASSNDLLNWTKHGSVFSKAFEGKYVNKWSKSGSIVSRYRDDGKIVAEKINGKYWMYWGDVNIWAATSDDLINWTPVLYEDGEGPEIPLRRNAGEIAEVKIVFGPRQGKFDSDLVEPGPPAMITDKGILLIYNSRNIPSIGDPTLAEGTYSVSQILMDHKNPVRVIDRMESWFLKPDQPYEMTGQINHVCFAEGLVRFKNKWFLYYGTADSKIGVAIKE